MVMFSKSGNGLRFLAIIMFCISLWLQSYYIFARNERFVPNIFSLVPDVGMVKVEKAESEKVKVKK